MRQARLFVLPSYEEGQGVVLVEALASGTPCVGSTAGGIPDVVTPDVGAVVEPGDADALAKAIVAIIANDQRWEVLSVGARQRAETIYNWDLIAQQFVNIYHQAIT